jgi:hypothetical protein
MQLLVVFGAVTFFARCFDQARPYWSVIGGKKPGAGQSVPDRPRPPVR